MTMDKEIGRSERARLVWYNCFIVVPRCASHDGMYRDAISSETPSRILALIRNNGRQPLASQSANN